MNNKKYLIPILLIIVVGCATASKEKRVSFEGKVETAKGIVLPEKTKLLFTPTNGGKNVGECELDSGGGFKLNNLAVGKYIVVFRSPNPSDQKFYKQMPMRYYEDGIPVDVTETTKSLTIKVNSR